MLEQYSIEEIPVNLNKILQEVEQGKQIEISQQGQQIAVIISNHPHRVVLHYHFYSQCSFQFSRIWIGLNEFHQLFHKYHHAPY
ncbi:type II toxin-antitoxin system Phd/YefM family antitoxin [Scytonema sp. NUACC21]